MKFVKSVLSSILSVLFIITVCPIVVTSEELPANEDILLQHGFPQELIDIMLEEQKMDLIREDCMYVDAKTFSYDENMNLINIITPGKIPVCPHGQIKPSHLKLTITQLKNKSDQTVVTFNYKWLTVPVNRYQDPICVAWDKDVYSFVSNSFRKVDQYVAATNNGTQTYTGTQSDVTTFAKANFDYVTWYADLKGMTVSVRSLFGYGKFTLNPKKRGKSTELFGHYVHVKTPFSISLGYNGAGFSVSGNSSYDELGTSLSLKS